MMLRMRCCLRIMLFACAGCAAVGCSSLPPGPIDAVRANAHLARRGHVYLLRGWNGLWSEGMDTLAKELLADGVDAHVYQQGQAGELADALLARTKAAPSPPEPLVLIGFSFGADESIRIARRLAEQRVPVDLLITIDPVTPPDIPPNARLCRNYYQSNGALDALPWLRGVPVRGGGGGGSASGAAGGSTVVNVNLRDRQDLLEPNTGHSTIAANPKLHRAIRQDVLSVCPPR